MIKLRQLLKDDGEAARAHLASGRPIFYCDDEISLSYIVREWPDGRRDLVDVGQNGDVVVVTKLEDLPEQDPD